jgi:hypothetical protein
MIHAFLPQHMQAAAAPADGAMETGPEAGASLVKRQVSLLPGAYLYSEQSLRPITM